MLVDKDKPESWVKYKESLCRTCWGTCCTMPVEVKADDLVQLGVITEDDVASTRGKLVTRLKKMGIVQSYRANSELFMITQRPNGDCFYLDFKTRLCTVYEKRPNVCRNFPSRTGNKIGFCPCLPKK